MPQKMIQSIYHFPSKEGINMNKIYKVIWSKAKHTYVVASEIAKGHTKGETTGRGLKKLAAAMLVAAALLSPNFVWAADMVKVDESASDTAVEVYTKKGTDTQVNAAKTYTYRKVAAEEKVREAADTELNERITNEANEIHKTTNQLQSDLATETADRKAADEALDSRAKALEDKTEAITYDKDSKTVMVEGKLTATEGITDGTTKDGQYVKADHYVGQNLNALDQGLQAETAARQAADTTLQTNIDNEAAERKAADTVLDDKITAETSARVAADTKLVEAVNSGLSLSNDNVLQKNTTTIDAQGNVTTSKTDANEMILNKGKDNQITLNENGIKVGTNSTVVDKDGVYTGGDTYAAAKAAMSADGKIKGANGAFTVDENGNVASKATITGETVTDGKGASMSNGTVTGKTLTDGIATITNGNINTSGSVTGGTVTSTGNISAVGDIHAGGAITGASASIQGALTAGSATITGDLTAGGAIQGKSISDGTATMQNGNITGVKNLSAETITTSGDATIGGDLTVNGQLNVDEIDLTKSGIVGDNNVTASTKVAAGEITSYKKATSTKDGSEKESAIDYDENGTSTWAKATDADGNWNKSTLTVEGNDVTSKVIDSDKNSNTSTQTASESNSTITGTADGKNYKSYITQNLKNILQGIKEGTNESIVDQTETGIKSTATDGKNTASTNLSNNGFNTYASDGTNKTYTKQTAESLTSQIGDDGKVKSVMNADGITNNAEGGTIYNKSKDILNEVSGDILNFADGEIGNSANKITNLTGDNTVTSDTNGTTFENKAHSKAIEEGSVTKTTISGNTITTGEAVMDYADVMKDLGVRGNAAVDGNTTLGKKGAETTLTVNSTSTFNKDVTMEENLGVRGTTTTDKLVVNNGAAVTGGTTTDTLKVTGSSEFDGKATFNDIVTMNKGLSVTGGVTADTVTAYSYKVGDKTYINEKGINANNQVIRNVGQGNISEGSTDAVSGGQLYETNTRVSGLETRMGTVETRVDKLDNKIDKVGANAAAMANLHPLEFDEDSKWNVAAAVGSSGSETASAVGVFYRPNENVMVNASAAMGTGENMFGGGVSLRLGHGGNKAKEAQMKAAAAENKELRAKVDDLTARMDALLSVLNPNMSKDFPDVPENHWAYEAVSRLAGNGIVEGYEDGKYHGERQMTRYEMAEIIYNALSKGAKAEKKLVEEFRPELQAMAVQKKA